MTITVLDLAHCAPDTLILTPNRRLSAWLVRDHDALMAARGRQSWPRLNAMPLDSWLQQLYETLALMLPAENAVPRLLTPRQSALLWRQVIGAEEEGLPDLEGLVQLAQQARALACRWRWDDARLASGVTPENLRFAHWHQQYRKRLRQDNLLDLAGLSQWVLEQPLLACGELRFPATIFLHGFNDHSEPQLLQLMQCATKAGSGMQFSQLPPVAAQCHTLAFAQLDEQFGAAVNWALAQRTGGVGQTGRIGIVIPNLQQKRADLRAICQSLWQQQADHAQHHWTNIINITAGQTLADYPLVSHLQLLLRALGSDLSLLEWNLLLMSPYFVADATSFIELDAFVQHLRDENCRRLGLDAIARRWQQFARSGAVVSGWFAQLQVARASAKKQSIPQWLNWLNSFVAAVQWGQNRTLSSEEFQVRQRTQETFGTLLELVPFVPKLAFSDFCQELNESLRNVQFQPQTETACIQVMGVLEAAGLPFDALWICECEASNWPQSVSANPLLPRAVQRALNMPGASPERELQYTATLLNGFRVAAPQVIFSWGAHQGDTEHALATLLQDLPAHPVAWSQPFLFQSLEQLQYRQWNPGMQILPPDDTGSALADEHAKGGSGIIKSQSLCPFKAFAEFRLNIRSQDELTEGVRPTDRGLLLHRVLEKFWLQVKNSAQLHALLDNEARLDTLLHELVTAEISQFKTETLLEPAALYPLEQERTFQLVKRWLRDFDGQRDAFSVEQVEKRRLLQLGGIELSLTVDRIDRIGNALAIIDYKTSEKKPAVWLGDRPEEPQLLLYTLLEKTDTQGIYFGVLHNSKMQYQGLRSADLNFGKSVDKTGKLDSGWDTRCSNGNRYWKIWRRNFARAGRTWLRPIRNTVSTVI